MALKITNDNFKETVLENEGLVLVEFWANWCGPCRSIAPVIDALDEAYTDILVGKINVDESSELAEEYRVSSIPTVILFEKGICAERIVGAHKFEEYQDIIDSHLDIEEA